jgi:hypothetical protein
MASSTVPTSEQLEREQGLSQDQSAVDDGKGAKSDERCPHSPKGRPKRARPSLYVKYTKRTATTTCKIIGPVNELPAMSRVTAR